MGQCYCIYCGNSNDDANDFCTTCGKPLSDKCNNEQKTTKISKKSKIAIIVSVSCVLVACGVGAVAFALSNEDTAKQAVLSAKEIDTTESNSPEEGSATDKEESASTNLSTDEAKSADSTAGKTDQLISPIDLENAQDYFDVNIFLSNFTESVIIDNFDRSKASVQDFAVFGIYHCGLNQADAWEYPSGDYYELPGAPGGGGAGGNGYNVRIESSRVVNAVSKYFDVDLDVKQLKEGYYYKDGYIYFGITAPNAANGIALAKSVTPLEEGLCEVEFRIYGYAYDPIETKYYGYTHEKIEKASEIYADEYQGSGKAIIEVDLSREHPFKLVSIELQRGYISQKS